MPASWLTRRPMAARQMASPHRCGARGGRCRCRFRLGGAGQPCWLQPATWHTACLQSLAGPNLQTPWHLSWPSVNTFLPLPLPLPPPPPPPPPAAAGGPHHSICGAPSAGRAARRGASAATAAPQAHQAGALAGWLAGVLASAWRMPSMPASAPSTCYLLALPAWWHIGLSTAWLSWHPPVCPHLSPHTLPLHPAPAPAPAPSCHSLPPAGDQEAAHPAAHRP